MPTGYTSIIEERENVTFKEFALRCARQFGALVTMREEPLDAPIPERFEPSPYYKESYENAIKKYEDFVNNPDKLGYLETSYNEMVERLQKEYAEINEKKAVLRDRYNKMLKKAIEWDAPTNEHKGLRDFMIKQLQDSIEFDCSEHYSLEIPTKEEWCNIERKKETLQRNIDFAKKQYEEEIEGLKSKNQWLKDLRDSLDDNE